MVRGEPRGYDEQSHTPPQRGIGDRLVDADPVQPAAGLGGTERGIDHRDTRTHRTQIARRRTPRGAEPGDHDVRAAQPGYEFGGTLIAVASHRNS
jgi:hypothetical protein